MVDLTFFALSPSVYMIIPQLTEQYGQVLRVSVVRASLKLRVSANAAVGEKPSATRLDPTSPAPLTRKNCLRFMSIRYVLHGRGAQSPTACVTAERMYWRALALPFT